MSFSSRPLTEDAPERPVGPPKPRGKISGFMYFQQALSREQKQKYPNTPYNFAAVSRQGAEKWKKMDDNAREPYMELARQDHIRHQTEMEAYIAGGDRGKRLRATIEAPTKPKSAFLWFTDHERPLVLSALKGASVTKIANELGRRWKAVPFGEKTRFESLAANDQNRYEQQLKEYEANHVYEAPSAPLKKGPAAFPRFEGDEPSSEEENEEDEQDDYEAESSKDDDEDETVE